MNPIEIAALFVVLVLLAVIVHQAVMFHMERRRSNDERKDLLNRLMARDFSEYAAGSRVAEAVTHRNLSDYFRGKQPEETDKEEAGDGLGIPVG